LQHIYHVWNKITGSLQTLLEKITKCCLSIQKSNKLCKTRLVMSYTKLTICWSQTGCHYKLWKTLKNRILLHQRMGWLYSKVLVIWSYATTSLSVLVLSLGMCGLKTFIAINHVVAIMNPKPVIQVIVIYIIGDCEKVHIFCQFVPWTDYKLYFFCNFFSLWELI